ncbi:decaprenyl-phosphate phosphoribosyltransferase [Bacteroidia bacterium]|nr:decaprenyl-phosphate phosphoribosyltransferase [Bacteroidia bacterium]
MKLTPVIQLLRPQQWSKNGFIFLPLFFNGQLGNIQLLYACFIAFVAFSLAASSIYCFNDIWDAEADKKHPKKCNRPIASGVVSKVKGYVIQLICFVASILVLWFWAGESKYILAGLILFYYGMNITYCMILKRFAIVDVMIISIGFVLRILVGGFATDIYLSEWIILMTFLLALFLAFAKRRDDVVLYQETGVQPRKNTDRYNLDFMNQVMTIVSAITIMAYIMYTVSPDVTQRFSSQYVYLTSFFVLAGIIRYLQVTIVDLKSGSPTKILMCDRFIQLCIIGWILSFIIIIYICK